MTEIWKEIKDYEGTYRISNDGDIYSYKYKKILKSYINNSGWRWVALVKNKVKSYPMVHKLVGEHFIKNPHNYSGIRPKKSRIDCSVNNLEWYETAQDLKMNRSDLIEYYLGIEQGKWWPLQKMLYKFFITQDSSHIEYIFKRGQKPWLGFVIKMTEDMQAAEDIIQNSFEMFLDAINEGRFRIDRCYLDYAPDTYIMAIIKNQALNWFKRDPMKSELLIEEYFEYVKPIEY